MIICPSSSFITHNTRPEYGEQIIRIEYPSASSLVPGNSIDKNRLIVDLALMCLSSDTPIAKKSFLRSSIFLTELSHSVSEEISLLLGLYCLSIKDATSAEYWFLKSAAQGSYQAMNLIGLLYSGLWSSITFQNEKGRGVNEAIRWFQRANKCGSIDSLRYMGVLYYKEHDFAKSLRCFSDHYQHTKSMVSVSFIASLLIHLGKPDIAAKWYKLSASNGLHSSAQMIVNQKRENNDFFGFVKWLTLNRKYSFLHNKVFNYSSLLRSALRPDFSIPNYFSLLHTSNKNTGMFDISSPRTSISRQSLFMTHSFFEKMESKNERRSNHFETFIAPTSSPTQLLIKIFMLASSKPENRNLCLASALLKRLYSMKPSGIFECQLFRDKCKSMNAEDIVETGFISMIIGDNDFALEQFKNASKLGNCTACLMSGIILFHSLCSEEIDYLDSIPYFTQAVQDPIAMVYLGTMSQDQTMIERVSKMIDCEPESGIIYEKIGDMFVIGTQLPKIDDLALKWYGYAMAKYEEFGLDSVGIVNKIGEIVQQNRRFL